MSNSATPWTVAHQAPPSMGFSRQEYWSGLPFPSPADLPDPGIEPRDRTQVSCIVDRCFPRWRRVSNLPANAGEAGDPGSIPGSGRSAGEGSDNPLQYSRLENSTDRGAWRARVHGVAKCWTRLSAHTHRDTLVHSVPLGVGLVSSFRFYSQVSQVGVLGLPSSLC